MLAVKLLGQFDVRRDGTPLVIPSRPGQSLFAFLLLNAGVTHRREKLVGLLWPDTSDDNVLRSLRQELWRLRKLACLSSFPYRVQPDELRQDVMNQCRTGRFPKQQNHP